MNNTIQVETQRLLDYEAKIMDQRISLLERTSRIFGKSPGIQDIWGQYISSILKLKKGKPQLPPLEVIDKLTELQGEFQSVLFLDEVYFGPKTKTAIAKMGTESGPWWTKPKSSQDALLLAMAEEIHWNLKTLPTMYGTTNH